MLVAGSLIFPAQARAAGNETDTQAQRLCGLSLLRSGRRRASAPHLKDKVRDSVAYRLVDHADAYGIGVHLWCVDLFAGLPGVDSKLTGTMSAVSVAFTIYSDGCRAKCTRIRPCFESAKTPPTRCRIESCRPWVSLAPPTRRYSSISAQLRSRWQRRLCIPCSNARQSVIHVFRAREVNGPLQKDRVFQ